jgi:hypothetical protein
MVLYWLRRHPEIQMISLFSCLVGITAWFPASFIFLGNNHAPAGFVMATFVFRELIRLLLCWLVVKMEVVFRAHAQVIHSSRFRLMPLGAGIGFGLGLTQTFLRFGTVAEAYNMVSTHGLEMWNLSVCPTLPFLYFHALSTNLSLLLEMCLCILVLPAVASWQGSGPAREASAPRDPASRDEVSMTHFSPGDKASTPSSSTSLITRKEILRPTSLSKVNGVFIVFLSSLLHLAFAAISLLNDGAFDLVHSATNSRGCQIVLPVQGAVVVLAIVIVFLVGRVEVIKRRTPLGIVRPAIHGKDEML